PKLMFHAQGSPDMRGHQRPDDHNRGVGDSKLPVEYEPNPADNDRIQQWRRDQVGHGRAKFHPSIEHVYKHRDRRARTKRRARLYSQTYTPTRDPATGHPAFDFPGAKTPVD